MGDRAPQVKKIFMEFFSNPKIAISVKLYHTVDIGHPFPVKNLEKIAPYNSRKLDFNFWGGGAFSSSTPLGARTPDLTLAYYGPRDPDKNSFCSGGIGPHLGEI